MDLSCFVCAAKLVRVGSITTLTSGTSAMILLSAFAEHVTIQDVGEHFRQYGNVAAALSLALTNRSFQVKSMMVYSEAHNGRVALLAFGSRCVSLDIAA